jgi:hypothetical protein
MSDEKEEKSLIIRPEVVSEMTHREHYDWVQKQAPKPEGAHGWIQWKGTDVCIDIHCTCGALLHIDAEFMYYVRCSECKALYAASPYIKLVPLPEDQRRYVESECDNVIKEATG